MTEPSSGALAQRVLVLPFPEPDASLIRAVFDQAGLAARACADVEALCREAQAGAGAALLAEEHLGPDAVQCLVDLLGRQPLWSDFPLVVFFGSGGETTRTSLRLLDLLEPLGNVTILERPVPRWR